jgi:hypothetical protein
MSLYSNYVFQFTALMFAGNENYKKRAEECKKLYIESAKLPRKKKKSVRKKLKIDYSYYMSMQEMTNPFFETFYT